MKLSDRVKKKLKVPEEHSILIKDLMQVPKKDNIKNTRIM